MGGWSGPDFKTTGIYLRKHDIGQLLYSPIYMVDPKSALAKSHPDWSSRTRWNLSKPEVVDYLTHALERVSSTLMESSNGVRTGVPNAYGGKETLLLGQDQGFRQLLRNFLDQHRKIFPGVQWRRQRSRIRLRPLRIFDSFSDGGVGILSNYWISVSATRQTGANGDFYEVDKFEKATYPANLAWPSTNAGRHLGPAKTRGMRQMMRSTISSAARVWAGRWAHVYRPSIDGDDQTIYSSVSAGTERRES